MDVSLSEGIKNKTPKELCIDLMSNREEKN